MHQVRCLLVLRSRVREDVDKGQIAVGENLWFRHGVHAYCGLHFLRQFTKRRVIRRAVLSLGDDKNRPVEAGAEPLREKVVGASARIRFRTVPGVSETQPE